MEDCLNINCKLIREALIICLIQYFEASQPQNPDSGIIMNIFTHVVNNLQ